MNKDVFGTSNGGNRLFMAAVLAVSFVPTAVASLFQVPPGVDTSGAVRLGAAYPYVAILIAPVFETFFLQYTPVYLIQKYSLTGIARYALLLVPFTALHVLPAALAPSLVNGLGGACILGGCYLVAARRSHPWALVVTAGVHCLHNAVLLVATTLG